MEKKKKKKKSRMSAEKIHRQLQDQVQVLPYFIDQQKKEGKWFRAFVLRYVSGPIWRTVNRILNARRYRGEAGQKLKQTEQMRLPDHFFERTRAQPLRERRRGLDLLK